MLSVIASLALLGACGRTAPTNKILPADQALQTYGYGPVPDPRVTYQPAVIMVGGGSRSVRSASSDGTVWIIDRNAEHAKDLAPGKIMLLTSRAAGRVMSIEPKGSDLAVTLGPMQFGELVRDAKLDAKVPVNVHNLVFQSVPDQPGIYRDLNAPKAANGGLPPRVLVHMSPVEEAVTPAGTLLKLLPIQIAAADASLGSDSLPQATSTAPSVTVGGFEVELSKTKSLSGDAGPDSSAKDRIGLKVSRKLGGLKAGIDIGLWVNNLTFRTRTVYSDGKPDVGSSTIVVEGIEGLDMDVATGIANAVGDNKKVRIEVPIEIVQQVPPAATEGIPIILQVRFKFIFETALGGNNATLSAKGTYAIKGPIGIENGKVLSPEVTESSPIIDAVEGVSLGVSAYVFSEETRFLFGLGIPSTFGGPYVKLVVATSTTKGSDLSVGMAPICHASTAKFDVGAGLGVQFTTKETDALAKLLGVKGGDWDVYEQSATVYKKNSFKPDINMCRF